MKKPNLYVWIILTHITVMPLILLSGLLFRVNIILSLYFAVLGLLIVFLVFFLVTVLRKLEKAEVRQK